MSYQWPLPTMWTSFQRSEWLIWPSYELSKKKKPRVDLRTAGKNRISRISTYHSGLPPVSSPSPESCAVRSPLLGHFALQYEEL